MKKLKYLLLLFAMCITTRVYAQEINISDVPASTYIIGKYMFTRSGSAEYNGRLTTQHIMKASQSIEGSMLDDMLIYYKNARSEWVNALTDEKIVMNGKITIENIDMEEAYYGVETEFIGFDSLKAKYLVMFEPGTDQSLEVYVSDRKDGEYTLYKDIDSSEIINDRESSTSRFTIDFPENSTIFFKIKTYRTLSDDSKEYLYSSSAYKLDTENFELDTPIISAIRNGINGDNQEYLVTIEGDAVTKTYVYAADSIDGEYTLLTETIDRVDPYKGGTAEFRLLLPKNVTKYIKIKQTLTDGDGQEVDGEFSNIIKLDSTLPEAISANFEFVDFESGSFNVNYLVTLVPQIKTGQSLEVYTSDREDGEYTLYKTVDNSEITNNSDNSMSNFNISFFENSTIYVKFKTYETKKWGKIYYYTSNVYKLETEKYAYYTPTITATRNGIDEGNKKYLINIADGLATKTYVYASDSIDGEYTLLTTISDYIDFGSFDRFMLSLPKDDIKYIKVKQMVHDGGHDIETPFSNIIKLDDTLIEYTNVSFGFVRNNDGASEYLFTINPSRAMSFEVYAADSENGTFELYKDIKDEEIISGGSNERVQFRLSVLDADINKYYKIKCYYIQNMGDSGISYKHYLYYTDAFMLDSNN